MVEAPILDGQHWRPGQSARSLHHHKPGSKHQVRITDLRELVVDNFAGGGGASTGIALALGRSVDIAINHDPNAIAMHRTNHPDTTHYTESVWSIDPVRVTKGQRVGLAWFSPDCTHFSKAKGSKPRKKRIRGLAWVMAKWAMLTGFRVGMLENVEEFKTWGPLDDEGQPIKERAGETFDAFVACLTTGLAPEHPAWPEICKALGKQLPISPPGARIKVHRQAVRPYPLSALARRELASHYVASVSRESLKPLERGLGYRVEWRELRACDYGAPTIRKRFFLIARNDGRPIVWPEPTHGDPKSAAVKSGKLKPWHTTAEIIDWSLPCPSIFERARPLAENTLKRIAKGIQRFVIDNPQPFIVKCNHTTTKGVYDCFRGQSLDEPLQTITAAPGFALVSPQLSVAFIDRQFTKSTANAADEPLGTVTAGGSGKSNLVAAFLSRQFGQSVGHTADVPAATVTAGGAGGKSALVAAFLTQYHSETTSHDARGQTVDRPILTVDAANRYGLVTSNLVKLSDACAADQPDTEPVPTITAGDPHVSEVRAFLLKYYGTNIGHACDEPLQTVTSKHRFGLVTVHGEDYQIVDIGMRMLEPRELFRAQGFPDDYIIDRDAEGNQYAKKDQVARCGNAVPPHFSRALVEANLPEMCGQLSAVASS